MASNVPHNEFRDGDNSCNAEGSQASTSNMSRLKEQLSSSEQRVKDLEAILQDKTETRFKDQLFSSEQKVKDLEAMLLEKNEKEIVKDEENIERTTTLSRTHVKDLESMLLDKNETKEMLKEQLSSSEQRVKDVQTKLFEKNESKNRLKDQLFSSEQRVKDLEAMLQDKNKTKETLKEQLSSSEQRVKDVQAKLFEKNENLLKLAGYVQSNPFHVHVTGSCRDVNVGNTNQLVNMQDEESIDDIKSLIEKLTSAVHHNLEKRVSLEKALKEHGNVIDEMKMFVKDLGCKQEEHHSEDSVKFDELLQCINKEVSEETIIIECIDELKQIITVRQLVLDKFESIPNDVKYAKRGIIRLVNKFGSKRWFEFANIINVDRTSIRIQTDDTNRTLNRDKCTKILVKWIKDTENTGSKLVDIIKKADKELSNDMVRTFSNEIKGTPKPDDIRYVTSPSLDMTPVATDAAIVSRLPRFESKNVAGILNQQTNIIEIFKFMEVMAPKIEENHRILQQLVQK